MDRWKLIIESCLSAVTVVFLGFQIWILFRQSKIMENQENIAKLQQEISATHERPWIYASGIKLSQDITHDKNGVTVGLAFDLKNGGNTSANDVRVGIKLYLSSFNAENAKKAACGNSEHGFSGGEFILPTETKQLLAWDSAKETDVQALVAEENTENSGHLDGIGTTIIACIVYKSLWEEEYHHTLYHLALTSADHKESLLPQLVKFNNTIPVASAGLGQLPFGSLVAKRLGNPD